MEKYLSLSTQIRYKLLVIHIFRVLYHLKTPVSRKLLITLKYLLVELRILD